MTKHKGKDVTILQEIPSTNEERVRIRNADGTSETVNKKDLALEHTQQLSKHVVPKVVKDLPKAKKETNNVQSAKKP